LLALLSLACACDCDFRTCLLCPISKIIGGKKTK
jgi:hypothetical protein